MDQYIIFKEDTIVELNDDSTNRNIWTTAKKGNVYKVIEIKNLEPLDVITISFKKLNNNTLYYTTYNYNSNKLPYILINNLKIARILYGIK